MKSKKLYIAKGFQLCGMLIFCVFFAWTNADGQTNFSEVYGFEPHFVRPGGGDGIKDIKLDYGAVGNGVTDDTPAFQAWAASGERTLYLPAGTYLVSDQIRYGSGMKRVLWIGEKRSTTIIKLKNNASGFNNPSTPKNFIYCIAAGQQGEQNMQNYIYHLTVEIGTGNSGAVAISFHTNNSGGLYDVAVKASDPVSGKGLIGIGLIEWGGGPGMVRFAEINGFDRGIQVSTDNHWTLEHIKTSNCNVGLKIEKASSIRDFTSVNCSTGINCSSNMALVGASITKTGSTGDAVYVSNSDVMISNLTTSGYALAINSAGAGDGNKTGNVTHWIGEGLLSQWTPGSGMNRTMGLPVEESPAYQYAQTSAEWALATTTAQVQSAIDAGKTHVYIPRNTALTGTIYLRNNLKHIFFLGQSAAYTNLPTYVLQNGTSGAVVIEQDCGGTLSHQSTRTIVLRHDLTAYTNTSAANGGKVFIESNCSHWQFYNNVKAWLRDANTEYGGSTAYNIDINNSTVWILGLKTEDFATKIKVANGGYCELLGGTFRQNWDATDFASGGLDVNNPPPLFLIDNSHASFAAVSSWGPNIPYDPMVREIRSGTTKNLSRSASGGGAFALYVGYTSGGTVPVTGVSVSPTSASINVGGTQQLTATVSPSNATNKNVSWSSSNSSIASVNSSGLVTGVAAGSATITVTTQDGGKTATSAITVNPSGGGGTYVYEGFDYSVGNLSGQNGGTGWSGSWTSTGTVVTPGLTYTGCSVVGNKSAFANQTATRTINQTLGGSGKTVWMKFIMFEGSNGAIINVQLRSGSTCKMAFLKSGYANWGINSNGTSYPGNLPWANEKTASHFWLFKMVFGSSNVDITVWRDPDLSSEPTSGGTTVTIPTFTFNNIYISQTTVSAMNIDEIRIGAAFADTKRSDIKSSGVIAPEIASNKINNISIFPNPTYGQLKVQLPDEALGANLSIYNYLGVEVYLIKNASSDILNIDISNQPAGIYIIKIKNSNNNNSFVKQIILTK